jgi:hypothetical protein
LCFRDQETSSNARFSKFSPFYTTVVNLVIWTLSIIPAVFAIWQVDDRRTAVERVEHSGEEENHAAKVSI